MKIKLKIEKEVEIKTLIVYAEVRHFENASVNGVEDEEGTLIPCRIGDTWKPMIDIDSGKILNWDNGKTAEIHYKVCDCCGWKIMDENEGVVLSAEDGYVPETLSPKENGYGDYIIMDIDENGQIADWKFNISDFSKDEE